MAQWVAEILLKIASIIHFTLEGALIQMSFLTVEKPYRSFYRIQRILNVNIFSNRVNPFPVLEGRSLPVSTYDNYNGRHLLLFPCDAECNFPRYYACLLQISDDYCVGNAYRKGICEIDT